MSELDRIGRFDRVAWLEAALEVLAREGQAKLNVEKLAAELGVTKGSFYHHFQNREDFIFRLLKHWEDAFTNRQAAFLRASKASGREKLKMLMDAVYQERLTRYDTAFRSWAAQDSAVAEIVRRVDLTRYCEVLRLFQEMGFEGEELRERTQLWLLCHSALESVHTPDDAPISNEMIERRLDFFTSPRPAG